MGRQNIFELLANSNSIEKDSARLIKIFTEYTYISVLTANKYSLEAFVDRYCFDGWISRGRCLDIQDFYESIGIDELDYFVPKSVDDFLLLVEMIYNFLYLARRCLENPSFPFELYDTDDTMFNMLNDCLADYNQKAYYFPEKEQCIVAEDSPQVTAAAEAADPKTAIEIVRYNHYSLKGDITKKRSILLALADYLEGRKAELTRVNNSLYSTISGALNNLNIRHNNINPDNKGNYKQRVAEMTPEELEGWYDEVYQLILLAILEMDNTDRQHIIKELVQKINEK